MSKRTVFIGLSGGVDSSVSAALLQREGFDVVGVHMKCWSSDLTASCTASDDERMARRVASHLKIPFYSWNFIDEYKDRVVDYLIDGYRKGETPNPDIMCNKEIKFGLFYDKAMRLGADYIAMGHYAKLNHETSRNGKVRGWISAAKDKGKDQSYFLSWIDPGVLGRVMFPLGDLKKNEVRSIAKKIGLPNANRKDSQGICFVGKVDIEDFLKEYIPPKKGNIVDMNGTVVGRHEGAFYYTVGQRKGIGLSGGPWYVVEKDLKGNVLKVSKDEDDILQGHTLIDDVVWSSIAQHDLSRVSVKLRYRQDNVAATLSEQGGNSYRLDFDSPQRAVTAGQFAALYVGDDMIGAGRVVA